MFRFVNKINIKTLQVFSRYVDLEPQYFESDVLITNSEVNYGHGRVFYKMRIDFLTFIYDTLSLIKDKRRFLKIIKEKEVIIRNNGYIFKIYITDYRKKIKSKELDIMLFIYKTGKTDSVLRYVVSNIVLERGKRPGRLNNGGQDVEG